MNRKFGWDLPPGVSNHMIEEQAGAFEEAKRRPWSLTITPIFIMNSLEKTIKDEGFKIEIYEDEPYAPNYNLPTELNEPDVYYATNAEELLEFLKGVYEEQR